MEKQGTYADVKMENDPDGEKNPSTPLTEVLEAAMDNMTMNNLEIDLEERLLNMLEEATKCEHWDVYVKEQSGDDPDLIDFYESGMDSIVDDPEAEARTWLQFVKAKGIEQTCPLTMAYLKDLEDASPNTLDSISSSPTSGRHLENTERFVSFFIGLKRTNVILRHG